MNFFKLMLNFFKIMLNFFKLISNIARYDLYLWQIIKITCEIQKSTKSVDCCGL